MRREIPSFVYDPALALYLPLWKRDGTSFISDDAYGHLVTVTGATWGIQGRIVDGTDDFISVPDNDIWDSADFTLLIWTKQNAFAGNYWQRAFIAHNTTGGAVNKWTFAHDGTTSVLTWVNGWPTNPTVLSDAWTLSAGVWYLIGLTRIGSAFTFYKDGVANGTATNATAFPNIAQPLTIGWGEGTPKTYDGITGEVLMLSRGYTPAEVQNYTLATKWRYQ